MAELLALRSCTSPLVSSYTRSSDSVVSRQSCATLLGSSKSLQSYQVLIWRKNHKTLRLADKGSSAVRAGLGDANGKSETSKISSTSEDWQYGGKFFAACAAGAVLIKYGSILVPSITQPNLVQALFMITTPVLVTVVVLLAASSEQKSDK